MVWWCGARRDDVKATLDRVKGDMTGVYDKYDNRRRRLSGAFLPAS
jgi:hypothetical protein